MKLSHAAMGAAVILLVVITSWWWFSGDAATPPPEVLAEQALSAPSELEQQQAAARLIEHGDRARPYLRRVFEQSESAPVRAATVQGLAVAGDYEAMPQMLSALDDPSPMVRGRAGAAVQQMLGADFGFRHDDPPEERRAKMAILRREWEKMQGSPLLDEWIERRKRVVPGRGFAVPSGG